MDISGVLKKPVHNTYLIFSSEDFVFDKKECSSFHFDDVFTIEDSRLLQDKFNMLSNDKIVLILKGITRQAQHSLLKSVEESGSGKYFFFCLPMGIDILDTLKSRCYVMHNVSDKLSDEFLSFAKMSPKNRVEYLHSIVGDEKLVYGILGNAELHMKDLISEGKPIENLREAIKSIREGLIGGAFNKNTLELLAFSF